MNAKLLILLPPREGFRPDRFGAISLCIHDASLHSRYRERIEVAGTLPGPGFDGVAYRELALHRKWYQTQTRAYANACLEYLKHERPALVEIHNRPLLLRYIADGSPGCPLALHLHNDPQEMKAASTPRERETLLERCAAIYCVSDYIRRRFLEGVTRLRDRVHVVYNGLALPPPFAHKQNQILFAGRLAPTKGGLLFARALAIALPQLPDWSGVIVGGRRHQVSERMTRYEQEVAEAVKPLGSRVEQRGFCDRPTTMKAFRDAAVAVVPSEWAEPFGRTALEAMAEGCAVISSGTGGLPEVTGDAALNFSPLTPEALAQAMIALARDDARRTELQTEARRQAAQFGIGHMTKRLDEIREAIIGEA